MARMFLSASKADFDELKGFDKHEGYLTHSKDRSEIIKFINKTEEGKYEYIITTVDRVRGSGVKYTELQEAQNG